MADRRADGRARKPRDVVVVALVGSGVGVALYPLAFLLAQVVARSCRGGGLETVGPCLLGGLGSLVLAALILCGAAGLVLWRASVRLAPVVAVLAFVTAALLAWRSLYAFNDLQTVLGRGVVWIGAIAFPMLFVGWFRLLRSGRRHSLVGLGEIVRSAAGLWPRLSERCRAQHALFGDRQHALGRGDLLPVRRDATRQPIYAVQLGSTVVTVRPPARAGTRRAPEPEFVTMLRSLQPLPPGELAARNRAVRRR